MRFVAPEARSLQSAPRVRQIVEPLLHPLAGWE